MGDIGLDKEYEFQGCAHEEEEYHRQENHAFFQIPIYDLAESGNN
jgi:hypothetical protein